MVDYLFPEATPGSNVDDGGTGMSLGFLVAATEAGVTATGIRWYAPSAMNVTPYLWSSAGAVLATGDSVACVTGWNVLPFTTPYELVDTVDVIAGTFQPTTQKYTATAPGVFPATVGPLTGAGDPPSRFNYSASPGLQFVSGGSHAWFGIDLMASTGGLPLAELVIFTATGWEVAPHELVQFGESGWTVL